VVYEGDLVGSAAIAIKRWVFDRLADQGYEWPHFRYSYPGGRLNRPGEEIYFARTCEEAGIHHYCDATFETPHWTMQAVGKATWDSYRRKHPEFVNDLEEEGK